MADVIALVDDLFFQAKIRETGKKLGIEVQIVATPDELLAAGRGAGPALLLVDLNARSGGEVLERLNRAGNQKPVVAFLSHVQADLAARARAAGCSQVLPRSKFTRELAAILSQARPR